ncbi:TetR/AcrR family transcriptional regulator [Bacillus sp. 2205SS5-2]|uniref:TetR/AcrR family transcriptional regulator n=1 Tax=Bacillus sp. 2205SS5-2 TaxID=3109031 RepID=UPI003007272E
MKAKITEKSIELFEKKGFSETSIQDIVDALNVTKGTFYYYFSSKEELLMDIHLAYIDEMLEHQQKIIDEPTMTCKEKLNEMVYMLIRYIEQQGPSAKVFFREMKNLSEERIAQIIPKRDLFRIHLEGIIKKGMEEGEFRSDLNPSIVTFGILGMSNWSYQWFNPAGEISEREVTDIYLDMILNGIQHSKR